MYRLREYLTNFFYGRNGIDNLNRFILVIYFVLAFINLIFRNLFLYIIIWLIFFLLLFRTVSKNIYKRQKENQKYLAITAKIRNKFDFYKRRYNDKDHVYKKCPYCKATIKLPRKKGKHAVDCPKCKKEFKVKI